MNRMRETTKGELRRLAGILVKTKDFASIKGTSEFIEAAVEIQRTAKINVDKQTVKKQQKFIEDMCNVMSRENEPKKVEVTNPYLRTITKVVVHYSDGTIQDITSFGTEIVSKQPQVIQRIPEYTMFVEGEDGVMVIKGTYKGKTIDEIDVENFSGCKRGWAKWCLSNDKNLSDDDRSVFTKIMNGYL
jgi:hypothetical protein